VKYEFEMNRTKRRVVLEKAGTGEDWHAFVDGVEYTADIQLVQPNVLSILIDGRSHRVIFDPRGDEDAVVLNAHRLPYRVTDPRAFQSSQRSGAQEQGVRSILAPMPGRIVRILVEVGDTVEAHQGLLVMEAMKMQNELKAPRSGTVVRIAVEPGSTVQAGQTLVAIE